VATSSKSHCLATRRAVKRFGNWCPPVHHNWFASFIGNRQTTDMKALNFVWCFSNAINSTKYQRRITQVQCGQTLQQLLIKRIAFVTSLEGAARIGLVQVANTPSVLAALIQAGVGMVNIGLLGGKVWVLLAHFGAHQLYRQNRTADF
jgi:hypothetical protein